MVSGSLARDITAMWAELDLPGRDADAFSGTLSQAYAGHDTSDVLHGLRRENTRLFLGDRPLVENPEGITRSRVRAKRVS